MKNNSNAVLLRRVNPWSLLLILAVSLLLPLGAAAQNGSFPLAKKGGWCRFG